ncbi:MAG TPA: aspartate 1-decarboxylase [Bacteroidetes bacterium]|nr:aspartate 1-decarboxylase [Bacteroidota bacterium]HEX05677.1 aspartate 1-decarboxylase [Bacteroidota bacterium]
MLRRFLKAKLHQARVTQTDLHYSGSLTVDKDLLDLMDMLPDERVEIYNITNGHRFNTYILEGEAGSGIIGVNGAAAHLANVGDLIIAATYCDLYPEEIEGHKAKVVVLDEHNRPAT